MLALSSLQHRRGDTTHHARWARCRPRCRRCRMPTLSFESLRRSAPAALAVTLLALTEAVSIARAIAVRSRPAHRRQPGIHRPGSVQPRRQLLLRLCGHRLLQPQRPQLRGRRQDAAGRHLRRRAAGRHRAAGGAARRLSAQRGHGRHPVPGRLGPDRLPPHPPDHPHQPGGDRDPAGHLRRHPVHRPGGGDLRRRPAVAGDLSQPHLPPAGGEPGTRPAGSEAQIHPQSDPAGMPADEDRAGGRLAVLRGGERGAGEFPQLREEKPRRRSTCSWWPRPSTSWT